MALKLLTRRSKESKKAKSSKASKDVAKNSGKMTIKDQKEIQKRNKLVEQYLPYATSIAGRVMQTLSSVVDFDDVMCNARLGLIEAAKKFDPTMNVDFKTFSYYRIKGAIYDGLRKTGWIPRSLYAKIKFEQASNEYLKYMSERQGSAAKVATQEMSEMYDTVNSLASIYVISLDAAEEGTQEIEDTKNKNIEQSAEFQQVKRQMKTAIESLPDKERKLVKLYYFQNRTLEEAGRMLGLSKSWTSRLHARALEILFKKINSKIRTGSKAQDSNLAEEA
jgi:RNA polymerase sigma factor FliA